MIVIIDNFDSFTYNLYQLIGEINPQVVVYRNDAITLHRLQEIDPSHIIISPGPGYPKNAGISKQVISSLGKKIPILGVCLGHQAIGEVFGGRIIEAPKMFHGKTSIIKHDGKGIFNGIKNPLRIMRYHSLMIDQSTVKQELSINSVTEDGDIMSIQHKAYPIYGVQFHPESIMTECGKGIIENFLNMKRMVE